MAHLAPTIATDSCALLSPFSVHSLIIFCALVFSVYKRITAVIFPRSDQFLAIFLLFRRRPWHFDIESRVLIVAHYGQLLKPMLNLHQPFKI